jgi:dTDP-glucose 4,6-dehydratase
MIQRVKRVLLTGAGGAIGVHVIAHIMHNTDWEIVALDSFRKDHKGFFDRITRVCQDHPEWPARIQIFSHDLNASFTSRQIKTIGPVDYVLNLASRSDVSDSIDDPVPFVRNNTELMLTILDYALQVKPEVFLHLSTDEVYGPAPKDSGGHKEWDPIIPSNPYSASKAAQEAFAIAWWRCFGLPLVIVNTMNNFGEMQAPSKFPAMIQQKIERGEEIHVHAAANGIIGSRYYLHSRNVADALLFILRNVKPVPHSVGEIDRPVRLNVVGNKQVSNLEMVEIIGGLMGKRPRYKMVLFHEENPGHDLHYGLNGEELSKLGWKAPLSFEESMRDMIDWQKRNPEWMK